MMNSAPCLFERCKFDNACWRPLCPCKHSDGATRATRLSQVRALLAKQEALMAPNKGASNNTTDMVVDTMHLAGKARSPGPAQNSPTTESELADETYDTTSAAVTADRIRSRKVFC